MKILLTGASSFTGFWFARELVNDGHDVTLTCRRKPEDYPDDLRRVRARELAKTCKRISVSSFGDKDFLDLAGEGWDLFCHHAADVTNYKSPNFNVLSALENNTRNVSEVIQRLKSGGCRRVLITGSVFESDEGAGSEGLEAFSPYGLSKGLTWQCFRHYVHCAGLGIGKFVIPNPFGPYEEPRFTAYLIKNWFAGETPAVNTPDYVRDNIHVFLLAKSYAQFAGAMPTDGIVKANPSGYVESQGAFALRLASAMRSRLALECKVELKTQVDFSEPRIRINTDVPLQKNWDESAAWDAMAAYYKTVFKR